MQDNVSADGQSATAGAVSSSRLQMPRNAPETSQLAELSASLPPNMQSNFRRQRGFLNVNALLHAPSFNRGPQNMPEGAQDAASSTMMINRDLAGANDMSSNTQVIWGTNINASDVSSKLKNFIHTFVEMIDNDMDDDAQFERKPYYIEKLKESRQMEEYVLPVDCDHIWQYDRALYRQIVDYPSDIIPIFDLVVSQVHMELFNYGVDRESHDEEEDQVLQVRPFNLRYTYRIREIDPVSIDKLIQLKGIVIRCSDVIPEMKEADFLCFKCGREEQCYIERGRINEPNVCKTCQNRNTFSIQHNQCVFSDKQHVKIQETPESVPEGETPQTIHLCAYEDLVDAVRPGDRVEITGIYKAMGVRVNPNKRTLKNVYRTYVDVMNYKKVAKGRIDVQDKDVDEQEQEQAKNGQDVQMQQIDTGRENVPDDEGDLRGNDGEHVFSNEDVEKMYKFAAREECYDLLVDALAPSIWENQDVKKGILTQLFGGVSKDCAGGQGRMRGEINVLLCGDPSTAKSQLLQYVHKLAPRGIYTSGKGSSAVGLTVYITKDPETKELVLESGALVLSDRGICCIDEFDKMDENTRVILHEAMEQQTVSVAKAGIICTLNARTAILAAANPIKSKYDAKQSVVANINLPPTLLSRFDLIYLILDKQSEASDRRLANHIVSLFSRPEGEAAAPEGDQEQRTGLIAMKDHGVTKSFLANYISYARKHVHPSIPEHLVKILVNEYKNMRSMGNSRKTITATPRQLDSMIRIAEALAKMKLRKEVTEADLEESIRLIKVAMQQSATDPNTGEIDMGMINTGTSASSAERVTVICDFIKRVNNDHKDKIRANGLKYHNLYEYMMAKATEGKLGNNNERVTEPEFRQALMILEEDGFISQVGHSSAPTIRFMDV